LLNLIRLGLRTRSLEVDLGGDTVFAKDVMAALNTLLKAQALQQAAQILEPDGCIGCPAQNSSKDLV
jgi:hypothetical protein